MIQRLELSHWKAFDHLELAFDSGTTFIVARNGVGKTSIVQALAFGVFGVRGLGFDPQEAIRESHDGIARVAIQLVLPSKRVASIVRTVTPNGRRGLVTFDGSVDGEKTSESDLEDELQAEFGTDSATLRRLALLTEGAAIREVDEPFDPMDHITKLFHADRLHVVADEMRAAQGRLTREGDGIRRTARRATHEQRTDITADRDAVEHELREALEARRQVAADADARQALLNHARAWEDYETRQRMQRQERAQLLEIAIAELGRHVDIDQLSQSLSEEAEAARTALEGARAKIAEEQARLRLLEESYERFQMAEAQCPLCRRPLDEHDKGQAIAEYRDEIGERGRELSAVAEQLEGLRARSNRLDGLLVEARAPVVPTPSDQRPTAGVQDLEAELSALRERVRELDETIGALRARRQIVANQLDELGENDRAWTDAVSAYRRAELSTLIAQVSSGLADYIFRERAAPLSKELASRFERLWGSGRMVFDSRGHLELERDGTFVKYAHCSGGERALAIVLLRILTLAMSTRARFLILDEPLEHVDARNRRMLARLMSEVTSHGDLEQMLVTTYEERLTRRYAEAGLDGSRDTRVIYVDNAP